VEGVHFDLRFTSWRDLGWKALAVNVSDAAAMGATPRFALVTLGVGSDRQLEDFLALYEGMGEHAAQFGVSIVGGDVVSSPVTFINVALYAEAGERLLRRDTARPGQAVAVTGTLGDSTGGLRLLLGDGPIDSAQATALVQAHLRPSPRVREGGLLTQAGLACGMDLSDGLLGDARRLAEASGVQVVIRIDAIPVSAALRAVFGADAIDLALAGGEDYELLVAGEVGTLREAARRVGTETGVSVTEVGEARERADGDPPVLILDADGREFRPRLASWEHSL
jgi:thiamine-monophosphate kinase